MLKKLAEKRPMIVGWVWIALCIPAFLWWQESVPFLVAMSIYANIESSFATNSAKKDGKKLDEVLELLKSTKETS